MSVQTERSAAVATASIPGVRCPGLGKRLQGALAHVVWFWLAGLIIIFGVLNPFFFSTSNLQNVLVQATVLGLLGLAQSLVLLVGEIDLSIAAVMGISSALGALAIQRFGLPVGVGILLGVGIATFIGFINGLCVTRLKVVSLIESLGMMITLQGGLLAITQGNTLTDMPDSYNWIGQATLGGWPVMPLVLLFAFIAMGFISGVAGWLLAAWQMAITSNQGEGFLLYAIAAPIIGGVSVFGGRGGTLGILGGVLLLTVIHVGLAIVYVPSFYVTMIGGVLIFVAVAVDALRVNVLGEG